MNNLLDRVLHDLLNPKTFFGAIFFGIVFLVAAIALATLVRRAARRLRPLLSDVTGLSFASALVQVFVYLGGFVLYAHLVPELRAMGTALLAGMGVISIVVGLAAQNTLGNLIAGLSLVLYRPVSIGDRIQLSTPNNQLNTPSGLIITTVETISLGYTVLRDADQHRILVPNSVMMGSIVIRLEKEQD